MPTIKSLKGQEILDSRGRPTVQAACVVAGGAVGIASVPSGASNGSAEAHELRDGEKGRYGGMGCRKAAGHVSKEIHDALYARVFETQAQFDQALIELDGTPTKKRLGANALLAVSLAFSRAQANRYGAPLYKWMSGTKLERLPRPTINLFSGGLHAGGQVAIQDVLVVPLSASSIDEALSTTHAIYYAAAEISQNTFGSRLLRADEGGLAPPFESSHAMLEAAVKAIEKAGYTPGKDVSLAVDVAATHFHAKGVYSIDGEERDAAGMIDVIDEWLRRFPIVSVEDGLAEEDWKHWPALRERINGRALTLGDDLLCTNPTRIGKAVDKKAADALLLKANQIGTLTEAAEAFHRARSAGWCVTASARSGETEDDWLADLAVGWGADHIKVGSITQSERLAKYNRLLAIERETGWGVAKWPGR